MLAFAENLDVGALGGEQRGEAAEVAGGENGDGEAAIVAEFVGVFDDAVGEGFELGGVEFSV